MAHKKKTSYKGAAKKLKDLGFIDYDLRRNFNSGQKAQITKLARQYSELLSKPERFVVQAAPKGTKSGLRTAGFAVNKAGKAVIPLYDYESVSINRGILKYKSGEREQEIYLASSTTFHKKAEELFATKQKKLKRNQKIYVQIGDNHHFSVGYKTYAELLFYLQNKFQPKDQSREKVFAQMSIVTAIEPPQKGQSSTRSKSYGKNKRGK